MLTEGRFAALLQTLLGRSRAFQRRAAQRSGRRQAAPGKSPLIQLDALCRQLLSVRGEAMGLKTARDIIEKYDALDTEERQRFFAILAQEYAPDWNAVRDAFGAHEEAKGRASFQTLVRALEPPRQELFRRINRALGGTQALLQMRSDLLMTIGSHPENGFVDDDLSHLLRSWFNRGFLIMERIDWATSADLLERLIRYEAVHQIGDWNELRRRLLPADRQCYAFFHPTLANDPLIFVEIALTRSVPSSIQDLLAPEREVLAPEQATTAVFYSISNCQPGLQGISFGNFLIKQVAEELLRELPHLTTLVTLSPLPGFRRWLEQRPVDEEAPLLAAMLRTGSVPAAAQGERLVAAEIVPLAAEYLLEGKDGRGRPLDPVARFHLGNGARLERLCWPGDVSTNGMASSAGVMVNYLYDLPRVDDNHEAYANDRIIVASDAVRRTYRTKHRNAARESRHGG